MYAHQGFFGSPAMNRTAAMNVSRRQGSWLQSPRAEPSAQAAQRRLDQAHARYLSAIKALATTHKLLRPTLSPLELAIKFIPEEKVAAGLRPAAADPAAGVPVLN